MPMTGETAGLDFGLKTFLTVSDGTEVISPEFFKRDSKAIAKANRSVSGKQPGSGNHAKASTHLARLHRDVVRKRNDWQWIEDLNLKGMKALASGPSKVALRKWP